MNIKYVIACVLIGAVFVNSAYAIDSYSMSYVDGVAHFSIDGDLSEWELLDLEKVKLRDDESIIPRSEETLSATFQCFADSEYLYIAVDVVDDTLVFGEEMLGNFHWDDTVRISFPNMVNKAKKMRLSISCGEQGDTHTEYTELGEMALPYLWESLGAVSALETNERGYAAEVAIPIKLLSFDRDETFMNIAVVDDDDGEDYEGWYQLTYDYGISVPYVRLIKSNRFSQEDLLTLLSKNRNSPSDMNIDTPNGKKTKSDHILNTNENSDVAFSIMKDYWNHDHKQVESKIKELGNTELWMNPLLFWIKLSKQKYDDAVKILSKIAQESEDRYVVLWAKHHLGNLYRNKVNDYNTAANVYQDIINDSYWFSSGFATFGLEMCKMQKAGYEISPEKLDALLMEYNYNPIVIFDMGAYNAQIMNKSLHFFERALVLTNDNKPWLRKMILYGIAMEYNNQRKKSLALLKLQEIIALYSRNSSILYPIVDELVRAGGYEDAVIIYEDMMNNTDDIAIQLSAQLGLARIYYHIGFFKHARIIAEELMSSGDYEIASDARMIIYSIDNKSYLD